MFENTIFGGWGGGGNGLTQPEQQCTSTAGSTERDRVEWFSCKYHHTE